MLITRNAFITMIFARYVRNVIMPAVAAVTVWNAIFIALTIFPKAAGDFFFYPMFVMAVPNVNQDVL